MVEQQAFEAMAIMILQKLDNTKVYKKYNYLEYIHGVQALKRIHSPLLAM